MTRVPGDSIDLRLTVVMCTYNGAPYVESQLASILSQQPAPGRVIVADDGSLDGTVELVTDSLAAFSSSQPSFRFTVLEGERPLGVVKNVERGLLAVESEYVALADQDDVWLPGRLGNALELLDAGFSVVGTNASLVDADLRPLECTAFDAIGMSVRETLLRRRGDLFGALLHGNFLPGMTLTMRTEFALAAGPIPEGWMHDYWLVLRAACVDELAIVEHPLVLYRQHGDNQVGIPRAHRARMAISAWAGLLLGRRSATRFWKLNWAALRVLMELPGLTSERHMLLERKMRFEERRGRHLSLADVLRDAVRGNYRAFRRFALASIADDLRRR